MQSFDAISTAALHGMDDAGLDALSYGVIGLDRNGLVVVYNATEAALAGLSRSRVVGGQFFDNIAQCMNNFMVAQRFEDEPELDAVIDFVLTLRMKPTPVKLRLLQTRDVPLRYVLVERDLAGR
ncbi:PAS domain-containing protein [Polymorphobacter fuscus]|uniref:PAS domain-containing protein n=2 Tax=Sandarakinorhabdus fusca TaxID=1439888 RepID=A0A7C9GPM3_9SPHN|nr:PAS domain-containing protein [Polymorphobacter fuscus]MQT17657.1 PAS domain-containing protein [Polymorphobacter fuscus]